MGIEQSKEPDVAAGPASSSNALNNALAAVFVPRIAELEGWLEQVQANQAVLARLMAPGEANDAYEPPDNYQGNLCACLVMEGREMYLDVSLADKVPTDNTVLFESMHIRGGKEVPQGGQVSYEVQIEVVIDGFSEPVKGERRLNVTPGTDSEMMRIPLPNGGKKSNVCVMLVQKQKAIAALNVTIADTLAAQ